MNLNNPEDKKSEGDDLILLSGMGRSGTTWIGDIINHKQDHLSIFEPLNAKRVKESSIFKSQHYLTNEDNEDQLSKMFTDFISGEVSNSWIERGRKEVLNNKSNKILIKEIRTNLMFEWLKSQFPSLKIVLIARHPLQVISSWRQLDWPQEKRKSERNDLNIILSQTKLLEKYKEINEALKIVDLEKYVERLILQWCILNFVPLKQKSHDHFVLYESLFLDPYANSEKLLRDLGLDKDEERLAKVIQMPSNTNFRNRDMSKDRKKLFDSWRDEFSLSQLRKTEQILEKFQLNELYDGLGFPVTNF